MEMEARGIVICKTVEAAEELSTALLPEIRLLDFECRRTLLKGVQSFREGRFDICFISEAFPLEELSSFFSDVKQLQKESECVFVQVRESLVEGLQRNTLEAAGFTTIVSQKATEGDKAALAEALVETLKKQDIRQKAYAVESAVKLLIKEVDRVSRERKRGKDTQFSRAIVTNFVTDQVDFHSEIMQCYLKTLESMSEKGIPTKELFVQIPREVLERNLPGIDDGDYVGASLRVWEMLQEKFGREEEHSSPDANSVELSDDGD